MIAVKILPILTHILNVFTVAWRRHSEGPEEGCESRGYFPGAVALRSRRRHRQQDAEGGMQGHFLVLKDATKIETSLK